MNRRGPPAWPACLPVPAFDTPANRANILENSNQPHPSPMKPLPLIAVALFASLLVTPLALAGTPAAGEKAPSFEGKDQTGREWKLADFAGRQPVLLYFYPKDNTPGCTKEACGLRDRMEDF